MHALTDAPACTEDEMVPLADVGIRGTFKLTEEVVGIPVRVEGPWVGVTILVHMDGPKFSESVSVSGSPLNKSNKSGGKAKQSLFMGPRARCLPDIVDNSCAGGDLVPHVLIILDDRVRHSENVCRHPSHAFLDASTDVLHFLGVLHGR